MSKFLHYFAVFLLVTAFWAGVLSMIPAPDSGRYYNCDLAEISPDIPLEVKEQCRKLRHDQAIKKNSLSI
jgi:hypothetical protein